MSVGWTAMQQELLRCLGLLTSERPSSTTRPRWPALSAAWGGLLATTKSDPRPKAPPGRWCSLSDLSPPFSLPLRTLFPTSFAQNALGWWIKRANNPRCGADLHPPSARDDQLDPWAYPYSFLTSPSLNSVFLPIRLRARRGRLCDRRVVVG